MSTYLEEIAALIRAELPDGVAFPAEADHLFVLYAVLLRAKGTAVTGSDVHDVWAAWRLQTRPGHPSIVPFAELDDPTQRLDEPFAAAIRRVALRLS
ncbi:hypothetical protein D5S17_06690 [Pseudonocardiaceae bacterium YIM PH 21723]|nr:hypothetical protein D5S17_06690 [Pseudonocardiaceae bacterium YIM PH 21723]